MTENFNKSDVVYYFGTCLVDLIYPKAGMTGIELIQSEGVGLILPYRRYKTDSCWVPAWN